MNIEVYSIKQTRSEINDMLDDVATLSGTLEGNGELSARMAEEMETS